MTRTRRGRALNVSWRQFAGQPGPDADPPAATVSYFTHIDESQIAPEIDAMLKKVVAAEPKKDDVLTDYWKNSTKPVAQHQWGNVYVDMPTSPQVLNAVSVTIGGPCK